MDLSGYALVERDIIPFESLAHHLVERHAGAGVSRLCIQLAYLRGNQHPFVDNNVVERGYAIREFLALAGEQFLLQGPGLLGRRVFGARLPQRTELIRDIHHNLVRISLGGDLRLAVL